MEIKSLEEFLDILNSWRSNRPEGAKYPRVNDNPYGDNTVGIAFDEGWWACLQYGKARGWFPSSAANSE